jgi:uncharacterized protein Usg
MVRKLLSLASLVILAFGLLSSCDQLPGVEAAAIIGSINIDPAVESTCGGTEFHVLLCSSGTTVDPTMPGSVEAVTPVAKVDGAFPGTISDWYYTINCIIADVPAGTYFAFVWIDYDLSDTFDLTQDYFGFYDANATGSAIMTQPSSPNIVVPATGLLDIDIWCRYFSSLPS